jgi:hypothetical protein
MAEYLHFSRDSRLYMEKDGYIWSVPMLDGFSFSQATNASEVTLNEMEDSSGRSRRGRKMFTDSLSAAEWSFATYARPFLSAGSTNEAGTGSANRNTTAQVHAVEEALWVAMAGQNVYNRQASKFTHPATGGTISSFTVDDATDTDGGDRADATYTFNVGSGQNSTNITYTGSGVNAVLSVVVDTGVATCTFTEGGQKFLSGETVVVDGLGLGGDADSENMTITITAETMIQYTSAAASTTLSPDGTPSKVVGTAGAVPSYNNAGTASDKAVINFTDSNRASLGTFNLYFILSDRSAGRLIYKLENAVVNEASMDFDIDGIATINWSGMAGQIKDVSPGEVTGSKADVWTAQVSPPTITTDKQYWIDTNASDRVYISNHEASGSATNVIDAVGDNAEAVMGWRPAITDGTTDTGNFIRNRLTQLTLAPTEAFRTSTFFTDANGTPNQQYESSYQVALTGGNVTISNNISYLTPEEIGKVNQPIEHITGTRTVSGSLTCYLGSSDVATNKVADLFKDLVADNNTVINKFAITLAVGGSSTGPKIEVSLPTSHLEIPSHSIEDVISVETNFSGLGSSIGEGDEIKITYKAA